MKSHNKLLIILSFNLLLMGLEIAGGLLSHSLALLSDAGHMLTDSLAVFLSYMALLWSQKPANPKKTFGYHRFEVLAALFNGLLLLAISGYIFYEAFQRFFHPVAVQINLLLIIAFIGLFGNIFGLFLLRRDSHGNLNIRGAFLHILSDTLSSVGVIIGGIVIYFTRWQFIDSIIGIMIGILILRNTFSLLWESADVLLEATPKDINIDELIQEVLKISGVKEFHDIHVWTITSGRRALSAHLLIENITTSESQVITANVRNLLDEKFNISHSTLEVECENCNNNICEFTRCKTKEDAHDESH